MRKILIVLLMLVFCSMFVSACADDRKYSASIDENDVAKLTLFAYDGKSESVFGLANLGHAFLSIENLSNEEISIGQKKLASEEMLTLGTWAIRDHFGVWYNVESNYIKEHNKYDGRVSVTIGINEEDLKKISDSVLSNDSWNPLNNCSRFALGIFNLVATDTEKIDTPIIYTPSYLANNIKKFETYENNKKVSTENHLGYFEKTTYVSYSLQEGTGV